MGYHDRSQIPLYYWFADNFAVCDNWFASVLGPDVAEPLLSPRDDVEGQEGQPAVPRPARPTRCGIALKAKGSPTRTTRRARSPGTSAASPARSSQHNPSAAIDEFFDAAQERQAARASRSSIPTYQATDDHPAHNIQRGQAFVASVYKALAESPLLVEDAPHHHLRRARRLLRPRRAAQGRRRQRRVHAARLPRPGVRHRTHREEGLRLQDAARALVGRRDAQDALRHQEPLEAHGRDQRHPDCIDPLKVKCPAQPPTGMPHRRDDDGRPRSTTASASHSQPALARCSSRKVCAPPSTIARTRSASAPGSSTRRVSEPCAS